MKQHAALILLVALAMSLVSPLEAQKKKTRDLTEGSKFIIGPEKLRYRITLFAYDGAGDGWDSYLYSKPDSGGYLIYDTANPKGEFSVHFSNIANPHGDQSRRVLGETVIPRETTTKNGEKRMQNRSDVRVTLIEFTGPLREITVDHSDHFKKLSDHPKRSPGGKKVVSRIPGKVEVSIDGKSTVVDAEFRVKPSRFSKKVTVANIRGFFTAKGSDLGLKNYPGPVHFQLWINAYPEGQ